jgi:hypothetical protein
VGFCFASQAQVKVKLPKDFTLLPIDNADSAAMMLDVLIKKQPQKRGTHLYIEANKDCLVRGKNKHYYYENIVSVSVSKRYREDIAYKSVSGNLEHFIYDITFKDRVAGTKGRFRFNDRELAEKALAALVCLIESKQGNRVEYVGRKKKVTAGSE